jgi:hypothetical protein
MEKFKLNYKISTKLDEPVPPLLKFDGNPYQEVLYKGERNAYVPERHQGEGDDEREPLKYTGEIYIYKHYFYTGRYWKYMDKVSVMEVKDMINPPSFLVKKVRELKKWLIEKAAKKLVE